MSVVDAFLRQGEACAALGSPLYAQLCAVAADDLGSGGVVADVFAAWDGVGDPMELALPLRLLGTAHRLALLGEAPDLADHYPSCGGEPGDGVGESLLALVGAERDVFRADLARPVQTNETGRAAVLRAGLGVIAAEYGSRVRLAEIGSAAGLNLRLDRFSYRLGGAVLGGVAPHLEPDWTGSDPPASALEVIDRRGCDRFPIDVTTREGAARAESFVWPDMTWRFERMAAAVEVSAGLPAAIDRRGAGEWVIDHVRPEGGAATVLMHSVMWQYVPPAEQELIEAVVEERGAGATGAAPLAHLRFEPRFESPSKWRFELRLRTWPGGEDRLLATAHPHGEWVDWQA